METYTTARIGKEVIAPVQKIRYVLYARKSTESEERQVLSIDSQIKEMLDLAEREKLEIVEIRRESHSAKESGQRPVYKEILEDVRRGRFNGILTWAPDRLSRNAGDLGSIVDLMDQQLLMEIRTYGQQFKNSPNEKFLLMILCSQAKLENDNKSINVKRGLRTRVEMGLWPGKYPESKDIEEQKMNVPSEISWQREYLLRIIPSDDQVIYPEWIQFYDELPGTKHKGYRGTYAGVDLAISTKDSADYTAIVSAHVYSRREKMRIYILPNPIQQKLNFPAQVDLMKNFKNTQMPRRKDTLFVESVAYQEALPQMLELNGVEAESVKPKGDKRTRLSLTSTSIKSGIIKFPRHGCEDLIQQLVGFGVEKHDDLADAFSLLVNSTLDKHANEGTVLMAWISTNGNYDSDDDDILYYGDYVDVS